MFKTYLSLISLCSLSVLTFGQGEYEIWNRQFPEVDILKIIEIEQEIADSVENNPDAYRGYSRIDRYSFTASFTNEIRPLDKAVEQSMKHVFELFIGTSEDVNELVDKEYKFVIDTTEIWIPIIKELEFRFSKEIEAKQQVKLYCLFLNEHNMKNQLFNNLLISEFQKSY